MNIKFVSSELLATRLPTKAKYASLVSHSVLASQITPNFQ